MHDATPTFLTAGTKLGLVPTGARAPMPSIPSTSSPSQASPRLWRAPCASCLTGACLSALFFCKTRATNSSLKSSDGDLRGKRRFASEGGVSEAAARLQGLGLEV